MSLESTNGNGRRVCVLTGAAGVFGTEFCRRYRQQYQIAAIRNVEHLSVASQRQRFIDPLAPDADLSENAHPVFEVEADLTNPEALESVVDLVLARFGGIDLLVNAAGRFHTGPLIDSGLIDDVEDQFAVNVYAPLRLAVTISQRYWRTRDLENRARNRNVINLSSTAGLWVYPRTGQTIYSASKAALNFLTCHMAHEFSTFGVRVNAAAPNTFPAIVSTQSVLEAVTGLDGGSRSGAILVVDEDGEHFVDAG